jgi:hypothetical protein
MTCVGKNKIKEIYFVKKINKEHIYILQISKTAHIFYKDKILV